MGIVCVSTTGWLCTAAFAQTTRPVPTIDEQRRMFDNVPRNLFGTSVIWAEWLNKDWSYDTMQYELIRQLGCTHANANIPWYWVEEVPGKWYFEYVDHAVDEATRRGLAVYAYMGHTPKWAFPPEAAGKRWDEGYRYPPPDDRTDAFVEYCRQVARRYRGKVKYYQFWNEPNGCSWVRDGCGNTDGYPLYTKWLKIWYTAMKSEDPDCVLAAGALDYHENVKDGYTYLEGMYREGAKDYFDAFSIHPYDSKGTISHRAIEDTRRVMVEHGDAHKGIWISEFGWNTKDEDTKSERLVKTIRELHDPRYFYVTMAHYLCLRDPDRGGDYGLVNDDLTPRKSYHAFKQIITDLRWQEASRPVGRGSSSRPVGPRD